MTTSLALTTHGWPVEVTTTDVYIRPGAPSVTTTTVERIERWQIRQLVVTDTRSISVRELTFEGWQDNPNEAGSNVNVSPPSSDA
jgi:hypothetical protein